VKIDFPGLTLPKDLDFLKAELTRPSGKKEPVPCEIDQENTLGASFMPEEPGEHSIDVKKNGRPVEGSPFKVLVNVVAQPDDGKSREVGSRCVIILGIQNLNLPSDLQCFKAELTRPTGKKEPLPCEMHGEDDLQVSFTPEEPGEHSVDVKKNRRPIESSPYKVEISDKESNKPDVEYPQVGSPYRANFDIEEIILPNDLPRLKAELTRPSGKKEPIKCMQGEGNNLALEFTPSEVGEHYIDVKLDRRPVIGSPFKIGVKESNKSKMNRAIAWTM